MTRVVVADTGPLIGLARVDKLDLVRSLYERVEVPAAVRDEFGIDSGRPVANVLSVALMQRWINVQWSQDLVVEPELAGLVDPGRLAVASGPWAPRGIEQCANAFAAMLLMPPSLIERALPRLTSPIDSSEGVREAASVLETGVGALLHHLWNTRFVTNTDRERIEDDIFSRSDPTQAHR